MRWRAPRLYDWARWYAVKFDTLAEWLEDIAIERRRRKGGSLPGPLPPEKIVLHGGPKQGSVLEVLAGSSCVRIPAAVAMRAQFLGADDGPPERPKFEHYVYWRQCYGQVVDGDERVVYLSDGRKYE